MVFYKLNNTVTFTDIHKIDDSYQGSAKLITSHLANTCSSEQIEGETVYILVSTDLGVVARALFSGTIKLRGEHMIRTHGVCLINSSMLYLKGRQNSPFLKTKCPWRTCVHQCNCTLTKFLKALINYSRSLKYLLLKNDMSFILRNSTDLVSFKV